MMQAAWRLWQLANHARLAVEAPVLLGHAVCAGPRTRPHVALTFDDGPDERWTPGILDALRAAGARATFFCIGEHIEKHPDLARAVAAEHQIGTHLYSHKRGITDDVAATERELEQVIALHERILGERPRALRYPFGVRGAWTAAKLARWRLVPYHWTFSSLDSRATRGDAVVDFVTPRLGPGAIVLLHDGRGADSTRGKTRDATVAAMPGILAAIRERGLEAVTLDEMFAA
jgi:peptidoglycan/xylan/chitin deacetylase (PgdA/CDA1 family)